MTIELTAEKLESVKALARNTNTAQLYIWQGGEVVVDDVFDAQPVDVYAVQKGLLSLLFGIAEEKYLVETVDHVNHHIDPEWTQLSPWDEAKLSIEIMLTMTTGMSDELSLNGEIGKTWRYNNTAYNYLKKVLCVQTGTDLNQLSEDWLLDELDMYSTRWVDREQLLPDGTPFTALVSTARDLAQLGQLVLNQGVVAGRTLVSSYYLEQMVKPGSAENPAWGYCWWNNNQAHFRRPGREESVMMGNIIPSAPADLIAARGMFENGLYVVPSLEMVVARTTRAGDFVPFEQDFWQVIS